MMVGSPYPFFRLWWRPLLMSLLFPVVWAVGWPVASLIEQVGFSAGMLWTDPSVPRVRTALWHLAVLVPGAFGLAGAFVRGEIGGSGLAWSLPGFRRHLCVGSLQLILPIAAGFGLLLGRNGRVADGLAAFAVGLFWYLVPGTLFVSGLRNGVRVLLIALAALAILQPEAFRAFVEGQPLPIFAVAVVASMIMLRQQFGAVTARRQPQYIDAGRVVWNSGAVSWWLRHRGDWSRPLSTGRLFPWLHAAAFESGNGGTAPYLYGLAIMIIIFSSLSHFWGDMSGLIVVLGLGGMSQPPQLAAALPYPVSRNTRARLSFVGSAIHVALAVVLAVVYLAILRAVPFPESWFSPTGTRRLSLTPALMAVTAWVPLVLWSHVIDTRSRWAGARYLGKRFGPMAVYALVSVWTLAVIRDGWNTDQRTMIILALAAIAVGTWTLLWVLTARWFRRRDLGG